MKRAEHLWKREFEVSAAYWKCEPKFGERWGKFQLDSMVYAIDVEDCSSNYFVGRIICHPEGATTGFEEIYFNCHVTRLTSTVSYTVDLLVRKNAK